MTREHRSALTRLLLAIRDDRQGCQTIDAKDLVIGDIVVLVDKQLVIVLKTTFQEQQIPTPKKFERQISVELLPLGSVTLYEDTEAVVVITECRSERTSRNQQ